MWSRKGLSFSKIHKACEGVNCLKPKVIHCISHQKVLCRKYLNQSSVIDRVVSTVYFIHSCGLNHCQLEDFELRTKHEIFLSKNISTTAIKYGTALKLAFAVHLIIFFNEY